MGKKKICTCPTTEENVAKWKAKGSKKLFGPPAKIHKSDCILKPPTVPFDSTEELNKAKKELAKAIASSWDTGVYTGTSITKIAGNIGPYESTGLSYWDDYQYTKTSPKAIAEAVEKYKVPNFTTSYHSHGGAGASATMKNQVIVSKEMFAAMQDENAALKKRVEKLEEIVLGIVEQEDA